MHPGRLPAVVHTGCHSQKLIKARKLVARFTSQTHLKIKQFCNATLLPHFNVLKCVHVFCFVFNFQHSFVFGGFLGVSFFPQIKWRRPGCIQETRKLVVSFSFAADFLRGLISGTSILCLCLCSQLFGKLISGPCSCVVPPNVFVCLFVFVQRFLCTCCLIGSDKSWCIVRNFIKRV